MSTSSSSSSEEDASDDASEETPSWRQQHSDDEEEKLDTPESPELPKLACMGETDMQPDYGTEREMDAEAVPESNEMGSVLSEVSEADDIEPSTTEVIEAPALPLTGVDPASHTADFMVEREESHASHHSGHSCTLPAKEPQDAAKALWLDPADFSFSSGQQPLGTTPTQEPRGETMHMVAEDALYGHVWDMYCEHEELLTMAFEESILSLLQKRSELHSWRRRVRRLRRPFQEAITGAAAPPQSLALIKATKTADSYAQELSKRKESLLNLAADFKGLCAELQELEDQKAAGTSSTTAVASHGSSHRFDEGSDYGFSTAASASDMNGLCDSQVQEAQLTLAQAALHRKVGVLETELVQRTRTAQALEAAISEQERQADEAESRLAHLRCSLQSRFRTDAGTAQLDPRPPSVGASGEAAGPSSAQPGTRPVATGRRRRSDVVTQPLLRRPGKGSKAKIGRIPDHGPELPSPGPQERQEQHEQPLPSFGRDGASSPSQLQDVKQPLPSPDPQVAASLPGHGHQSSEKLEASALLKLRAEVHALKARCMTQARRTRSRQRGPARSSRHP